MPELSATRMRPDAIMICHGIWFDHDNYPAAKFRQKSGLDIFIMHLKTRKLLSALILIL